MCQRVKTILRQQSAIWKTCIASCNIHTKGAICSSRASRLQSHGVYCSMTSIASYIRVGVDRLD